jgi:hypothetical protein
MDIDWHYVRGAVVGGLIGGAGTGFITYWAWWIIESRRRISFTVPKLYFGPALTYNGFMGRNYPDDDLIELTFTARFFSNKSLQTGLHNFRIEFCRTTYMGAIPEYIPDPSHVYRDLFEKDVSHSLEAIELPPRQFISFELRTTMDRECWPTLKLCDVVYLSCETPEGKRRRFRVGRIRFPAMPPKGPKGQHYMGVGLFPVKGGAVIRAARNPVPLHLIGKPIIQKSGFYPEDFLFWNGSGWVTSVNDAKVYTDMEVMRSEGEAIKIWNRIPDEWLQPEGTKQEQ